MSENPTESPIEKPPVSFKTSGKVGIIAIETKLNIFSLEMAEEITSIILAMQENPKIKVIIFKTAGTKIFSAGWDLAMFQQGMTYEKIDRILQVGSTITRTIINCPKPTIAQIQGSAIGFGCILSMACDFRITAKKDDLFFQLPEFSLGIYPGTGATVAPLKTLGMIHTQEMLLTGNKIPLAKMNIWGGISEIVPIEELDKYTKKYAKNIAKADLNMILLLQHSLPHFQKVSSENLLDAENKFAYYYFNRIFKKDSQTLEEFLADK